MSAEISSDIVSHWSEIKSIVAALEYDVTQASAGCPKSGNRARRALRDLRKHVASISRLTLKKQKVAKAEKVEAVVETEV